MDGFCVPIKFEVSVSTHRGKSTVGGCPLLFLNMMHFSTKAEPKRTNHKTDKGLIVQELRRKEYMSSGKWNFRKKLRGNLCECHSSISKHERSSEEHRVIVSCILMLPSNTHSHLIPWTVCASLEFDNPFLLYWGGYTHRECCKGKSPGQGTRDSALHRNYMFAGSEHILVSQFFVVMARKKEIQEKKAGVKS